MDVAKVSLLIIEDATSLIVGTTARHERANQVSLLGISPSWKLGSIDTVSDHVPLKHLLNGETNKRRDSRQLLGRWNTCPTSAAESTAYTIGKASLVSRSAYLFFPVHPISVIESLKEAKHRSSL
jgi:hypothetical protein